MPQTDTVASTGKSKPTKAGFYLAQSIAGGGRGKETVPGEADVIVRIIGEPPYLRYVAWNVATNRVSRGIDPQDFVFGEELDIKGAVAEAIPA